MMIIGSIKQLKDLLDVLISIIGHVIVFELLILVTDVILVVL